MNEKGVKQVTRDTQFALDDKQLLTYLQLLLTEQVKEISF